MTRLSNWREESDLFEVVTGKMTDEKALKKVDEKKGIKNKVVINPKLTEAIKQTDSLSKGKIVKDKQVVALMRYYELIKELHNVTG